jgi:hypothetical protein
MHILRTNALPCEKNSDMFGDENMQFYARYNFHPKENKGIMEINVVKLRAILDEGPRCGDQ